MKPIANFCLVLNLVAGLAFSSLAVAAQNPKTWSFWDKNDAHNYQRIDHSAWDNILKRYVMTDHPSGINRFRYGSVTKQDAKNLNSYIKDMARLDPRAYHSKVQKAYWLNLYNALTTQLVLDHYPIESITKIPGKPNKADGPWDRKLVKIAGKRLSLNDIENRILRPIWNDHRIHFALNSASLGSPQVLPQAFTDANINTLLKQAGKDFINHPRGVLLEEGELQVSSIFDWHQQDFAKDESRLAKMFAHYANDRLALYLLGFQGEITYNHDWRLNDAP